MEGNKSGPIPRASRQTTLLITALLPGRTQDLQSNPRYAQNPLDVATYFSAHECQNRAEGPVSPLSNLATLSGPITFVISWLFYNKCSQRAVHPPTWQKSFSVSSVPAPRTVPDEPASLVPRTVHFSRDVAPCFASARAREEVVLGTERFRISENFALPAVK